MSERGRSIKTLVGKPEGKRSLGRFRRRLEDNIKMDLTEIGWEAVDWIHMAQGRGSWRAFVNTVMNLRIIYKVGNILTI
jgi:hypothetical protein